MAGLLAVTTRSPCRPRFSSYEPQRLDQPACRPAGRTPGRSRGQRKTNGPLRRSWGATGHRCCATARGWVLREGVAEDVVQHSLLKAWLALKGGTNVRELQPLALPDRPQPGNQLDPGDARAAGRVVREDRGWHDRLCPRGGRGQGGGPRGVGSGRGTSDMQRHAIVLTAIEGRSHEEQPVSWASAAELSGA